MNSPNHKFKNLFQKILKDKGYKGVRSFAESNELPRSPIMKAMSGAVRPTAESLERWCKALECSPQERKEIYHSVGYLTPEEMADPHFSAA